ncbi:hypothetical protein SPI_06808 [Niveomyces insectorum RCEF 264]|uniref:SWI5-dependent HO expression protein 3 n=1 Tax=Niveomyces insectorum RCEF 264 TaxID=1081102 RepID=A0A167QSA9_9HYPO|nr:hypothetical protein SPI_06808 [Niveomyces insectorum RCEF 264]
MGGHSSGSSRGDKPLPSVPGSTAFVLSSSSASSPAPSPAPSSYANGNGSATAATAGTNLSRKLSTIRAVTSFDDKPWQQAYEDEVSSVGSPSITRHSNSAFSSSVNSNGSTASFASQSPSHPNGRLKQSATSPSLPGAAAAAANGFSKSNLDVPGNRSGSPTIVASRSSPDTSFRDNSTAAFPDRSTTTTAATTIPNTNGKVQAALGTNSTNTAMNYGSAANGQRAAFAGSTAANEGGGAVADDRQADGAGAGNSGWDSTVGKAGLGKTGRVINRLVSDNEALKRDLKLERLKADEARQAARLLEDRMERLVSDYESRLLEASVTKTLLARKERQVESLQGVVELEKQRTTDAQERERSWRAEMKKVRAETQRQVEDATTHAALMEGRYQAISSHWRDQGDMVKRATSRMGREVQDLVAARRQDDDRINTLRDLCDQQDGNIKLLQQQKEDLARKFQDYKAEQERLLHDIKTNAARREADQERTLDEARQVLDKLKWALNVKSNIAWAS